MKELLSLNKYLIKYKYRLGLGVIFVTSANVFAVLPPVIVRNVLDEMYSAIDRYKLIADSAISNLYIDQVMQIVMTNGLLLLAFAVIRGVLMFFMRQTIIVMSRHIEYDMKNEIYNKYQSLDTAFFKSHQTGDLMSRISEDVSRVRSYLGPAIMYTLNVTVLATMAIWGMLRVNVTLTIYALFFIPLLAISMIKINQIINKRSSKIQAQLGVLTSKAQETFSGIRVIKSYVQEKSVQTNFERYCRAYRRSNINLAKTEAMYTPLMGIFIGLSLIITIYIGGKMVIEGLITVGNIAEFIIYISMLTFPVSTLGWVSTIIQRAAVSQKRINDFLKIEPTIQNNIAATNKDLEGKIVFENVSFTYPHTGIQALKNFNLSIEPHQKIAIIGKTGSGKSTLAHLLYRMYDVENGAIFIDNENIKNWDIDALRGQMSYVPQEVFLFSNTIAANIGFGEDQLNIAEIREAAKTAHVHKEIENLSDKYETIVGERGVMLSGGQKQRVSIARALAKDHKLIILDDCISAVDNDTEQHILANLKKNLDQKTLIIITHRIFRNWDFDKIIVLDEGTISEEGTHEELMKLKGFYYDMYQYQIME
ncbi:MAG TPA: ABC transporter ATP-binding protein [Edaphocola sp.]|nr:ABC transporter ATP-binding protein [Edaphocola sp.]